MNLLSAHLTLLTALVAAASLGAADSAVIKAPLHGTVDANVVGTAFATLRAQKSELIISARNLAPSHSFAIEVGGIIEGSVVTDKNGRASIRFQTGARKNLPVLDFDPRDQLLRLLDNGTSVLEGVVSGRAEDDGIVMAEHAELSRDDAPASARASVTYTAAKNGRRVFRVDLSNLTDGPAKVLVNGIERGELELHGKHGVALFESSPSRPGALPLDFDPRGSLVDIVVDGKVLFTGKAETEARGVNVASPSVSRVPIASTGADPDGSASATLRIDDRARKHFSVEVEDVPAGAYDLAVDGSTVGTIQVVAVADRTKGEIEFTADDNGIEIPLTFDPVGKTLTIRQGATTFFESVFDPNTTGIGLPQPEPPSELSENLTSSGLDPDASAQARYAVDDRGRHKFSVEIEDVAAGSYTLAIAGVTRGTITAQTVAGKVKGEIEFDSESEGGHNLLKFDPRGQTIEISSSAGIFFSHLFGNGSSTGGIAVTPFDDEVALLSTGASPRGEAKAELQQKATGELSFDVELKDVPEGAYELLVGGVVRTTINVTAENSGTRGRATFETEQKTGTLPLDFEVRGQEIIVRQGGTTFFSRTFPS